MPYAARHPLILAIPLLLAGCALPDQLPLTRSHTPAYQRAEIAYQLPEGVLSAADSAGAPLLRLEYPHPGGIPGLARATLRLPASPSDAELHARLMARLDQPQFGEEVPAWDMAAPFCAPCRPDDEVWILDLPKSELDALLIDLAAAGALDEAAPQDGPAQLYISVDRGERLTAWPDDPRLGDFARLVQDEGRLGGFVCARRAPAGVTTARAARPSSSPPAAAGPRVQPSPQGLRAAGA